VNAAVRFASWFGGGLLSLCFPPNCAICGSDTAAGDHLCEACASEIESIREPYCSKCSSPFHGAITEKFVCANCGDREQHFECAVACYLSTGPVRDFIHGFKYQGKTMLRNVLAGWLAESLDDPRIAGRPFDALVPVPLHHIRRREREFNQAQVLAELVAPKAGKPVWNALRRIRSTPTQTRLDRAERMENLSGAFVVRKPAQVRGRHLLLVDDVFTTGSTVEECSRVLLKAGAASVRVITVARA
jgi:competence protein ComFC